MHARHTSQTPAQYLFRQRFIVFLLIFCLSVSLILLLTNANFAQTVIDLPADPSTFGTRADGWVQQAKITANDGGCGDDFGYAVALSQNASTLIIGAAHGMTTAANSGSAYIFTSDGTNWSQQIELTAADAAAFDDFGFSVAISPDGNTVLVGARRHDTNAGKDSGAVYVFVRNGGTFNLQTKLTAADGAAGDEFGYAVAISGETALIGAPLNDDTGIDSGSAYIFSRSGTTWTQQAKLLSTGGASLDRFGQSVALDGTTAVMGAPFADKGTVLDAGMAVVFTYNGTTWTQQAKLKTSDAVASDYAGVSVALAGNTVLVGVSSANTGGNNAGAVYAFTRSGTTWTQQAKLTAADANPEDKFGASVALVGDSALIGAPSDDQAVNNAGAVYHFIRTGSTWTQTQKVISGDSGIGEQFGSVTALAGNGQSALVGAFFDGGIGNSEGAAYVLSLNSELPTPTPTSQPTATPLSPTATPTPIEPSPTPIPGIDLLVNGDFETDSDLNNVPDSWVQVNPTSDKLKCNKPGKLFAQAGECAYRFRGGIGENSVLRQEIALTVTPVTPGAGDTLYLSGFVNLSGTPNLRIKLRVKYADTNLPKGKITLKYIAATTGYLPLSGDLALILADTPTLIRVQAQNRAIAGKTYLDTLRLTWESNAGF